MEATTEIVMNSIVPELTVPRETHYHTDSGHDHLSHSFAIQAMIVVIVLSSRDHQSTLNHTSHE